MLTFYGIGKVKNEKIPLIEKSVPTFFKEVSKEDGIIKFKLFRLKSEPSWFLFYEKYQDEEAFEKHRKTKHVDDFAKVLFEVATGEGVKGFWEEIASI